jgi:DNA-binding MarR family transcriptional regulator
MGAAAVKATNQAELRANEKKWGLPLIKAGWCLLPTTILERQQALGLTATDVNILMHLVRHWWHADRLPFPSKRAIADCIGCHPSTVQRRIRSMEAAGFIKRVVRSDREHGQRSNYYDLSGLVKAATPYAQEALEERQEREKGKADRRKRKLPKLKVVTGDEKRR